MFKCIFLFLTTVLSAEIIQKEGMGWLEITEGQQILHLQGNPYQLGYQHGRLMQEQIASNVNRYIEPLSTDQVPDVVKTFLSEIPEILPFIPAALVEEMHGIADGANIPYEKILLLNLFPEMFHCSAITVRGQATQDKKLYHVRVLDYAVGNGLQNTAIQAIVKPDQGNAFLNVTYAGFIGSVTGMNDKQIAIGEIGGKGYGSWKGMPMSLLLRCILEHTSSLDEIRSFLESTPRTCEYHYIFSDGKDDRAMGVYATSGQLHFILEGTTSKYIENYISDSENPPKDCLILTRGDKYDLLLSRIKNDYGTIGVQELQMAILAPVTNSSNLHNVIFSPTTMEAWISHAGPNGEPACDQPYHHICLLHELLKM